MLPNAILHTVAAAPPSFTIPAASTVPSFTAWATLTIRAIASSYFGRPVSVSTGIGTSFTVLPILLNWEDTVSLAFVIPTAKDTSVGGTSRSLKLPLILSLPPIDGVW